MSIITFDNVSYSFGNGKLALDSVSFEIDNGEFTFLVGNSGAGKTTLMRLLIRELFPTQGHIFFSGEEISKKRGVSVPKLRRQVGIAFQDMKLLFDRTVEENIAMAMEIVSMNSKEIHAAVGASLDLVGLRDKAKFFPIQLSGGEIQRVGLARAIVGDPKVVFADEPTANLDEESSWQIASLLKEIHRGGKTVIVATHNLDMVKAMGERTLELKLGKLINDKPRK